MKTPRRHHFVKLTLPLIFLLFPLFATAHGLDTSSLEEELATLQAASDTVLAKVDATTLNTLTFSDRLAGIEADIARLRDALMVQFDAVDAARLAGETLSLDPQLMGLLQSLSDQYAAIAQGVQALAQQVVLLSATSSHSLVVTASETLLRLSDDIGTMADRILEMADKILVMADNIGIMADRILATQIIQNSNIALVVDAILQTQRNAITLIALFS